MWVFRSAHQHKLLLVCYRKLHTLVSVSRVGSQVASYHITATLLSPQDRGVKPAERRHLRGSNTSKVHNEPPAAEGRQGRGGWRSAQSKSLKDETGLFRTQNQGRKEEPKVSSELRKLSLEDFPPDKEKQVRQKPTVDAKAESFEMVFGIAPCLLALTQGRRKASKLFVKRDGGSQRTSVLKVCEEAHRRGVQISQVSKKDLDKMSSGGVHQGVCLRASPLSFLSEIAALSRGKGTPLWLVLDRIQDPMNLGAMLRSAYFLGVDGVISSLRHSCPLTPVVSKASSGVMEVMGVYGCDDLEDLLQVKVAQGWQVVGTVGLEAGQHQTRVTRCSDFEMTCPTLLLMGGEGSGLSQELLSLCQTLLTVPAGRELSPGVESLNVSVAAGVLLHSLLHSRRSA
ncbi:rRNA methyltransferase 1, mitochondrial [Cololabis saira]|uniref:rRNA methyltransferase 1, mitochondrial n=1 Tax=Cololabis saira TaxID=129043 RepID=UPI002AD39BE3|nr:rRNA methyltransferase 1, mitochondrial [Cololabis saira]